MSLLEIRRWPDPVLSLRCEPVGDPSGVATFAQDMLETMYAAPGRGLAAPQVGRPIRLFVMDVTWKDGAPDPFVCINPEILDRADESLTGPEGCLSIPGVTAEVPRARWIVLRWQTPAGSWREARLEGAASICAQHEYDHLDGIVTFDRVPPEQRASLEADYAG
ncbi:peptide deformylase [Roseibacterium sp. SDUM158017]|uniref:peptide deformylase n=1 Tax=Roseicyclus salinarum TaxID=3036773 RepID=UPI0024158927|nr:peptide deformylase [Roseibacterium sp. SDUM158017]MDG4648990.1 peptide deformylase [Roseibacterium sp. SDUM158017]